MFIIITSTDLEGKRMSLLQRLPENNQDLLFHHLWILARAGNMWSIKNFNNVYLAHRKEGSKGNVLFKEKRKNSRRKIK